MTETWAGMLRDVANRVCADHWHTELCECEIAVPQLRRLASLLEQITPEMVERCVSLPGIHRTPAIANALRALSTAPTEETEDR